MVNILKPTVLTLKIYEHLITNLHENVMLVFLHIRNNTNQGFFPSLQILLTKQ